MYKVDEWLDERIIGDPIQATFTKSLRDYQGEFIANHMESIKQHDDIVVEAGCGSGKTVLSLYLLTLRKRKTIVLVPTNFLADQYDNRARNFLSGVTIVRARPTKKIEWEKADILIISYELYKSRKFEEAFYYHFGHIIIDEGHRLGADTHEETTARFHAKYRTMLTATFRREDGGEKILTHHFQAQLGMPRVNPDVIVHPTRTGIHVGDLISLRKFSGEKMEAIIDVLEYLDKRHDIYYQIVDGILEINLIQDNWKRIYVMEMMLTPKRKAALNTIIKGAKAYQTNPQYSTLDSYVANLKSRNSEIIRLTLQALKRGRKILILGKRKAQLYNLQKTLAKNGVKTLVIVSETLKALQKENKVDEATAKAEVVLGIDKLAKEGMDVDTLDTLILIHPVGDVEQAMGRVARIKPGKKEPIMLYLVDDTHPYKMLYKKSQKFIPYAGKEGKPIILNE